MAEFQAKGVRTAETFKTVDRSTDQNKHKKIKDEEVRIKTETR
jgi:hypothetical protein